MDEYKLKHVSKKTYKHEFKFTLATCGLVTGAVVSSALGSMIGKEIVQSRIDAIKKHHQNLDLSYEEMINCELLELKIGLKTDLFLCRKTKKIDDGITIYSYDNIMDGTNMYNEIAIGGSKYDTLDVIKLINRENNIKDYLINFNKTQEWYTPKEQRQLLDDIRNVYSFSFDNKVNKGKKKILS